MVPILLYVLLISGLLSGVALAIDRALSRFGYSVRGLWCAVMLLSVGWPVTAILMGDFDFAAPVESASLDIAEYAEADAPLSVDDSQAVDEAVSTPAPQAWLPWTALSEWQIAQPEARRALDRILIGFWIACSVLALTFYVVCAVGLRLASSRWQMATIARYEVLVSERIGPAMFGLFRPRIVVPEWLLQEPDEIQSLVLKHEQAHVTGRDQWLLYLALLLVAAMPWNLVLLWQLRELRYAIERDCDKRVLTDGTDPVAYSKALFCVSRYRSAAPMVSVALTEPASRLESRIRSMIHPSRSGMSLIVLSGLCASALLASATAVEPPKLRVNSGGIEQSLVTGENDMNAKALLAATLIGTAVQAGDIDPEVPEGWRDMMGTGPALGAGAVRLPKICEIGIDTNLAASGQGNLTVRCPDPVPGTGGFTQRFPAYEYRGKRVRFSALVMSQDIRDVPGPDLAPGFNFPSAFEDNAEAYKGLGGLYLRVGINTGGTLVRDDMSDRPITGTMGWTPQEIVVDVPEDAVGIMVGVWMQGQGQIWMSNITFEEVSKSVPVTAELINQGPQNLDLR